MRRLIVEHESDLQLVCVTVELLAIVGFKSSLERL
jgi:hypothetical protein